ncbi:MAG: hypothetical protein LBL44_13115 [Treponema sp.]|jgi:hypothetical protein|nr:hypothetical protein [Treponema sp.]
MTGRKKDGGPTTERAGTREAKKKPPARQTAGQGASKQNTEERALAEELGALIPRLDAEGLTFLIEQARVHLYNMQAEELNNTLLQNAEDAEDAEKKTRKSGQKGKAASESEELRIEGSESGSSFYLIYKGKWIMFSRDEIIALAKITAGPGTDLEIRERLYNWIERERSDLFETMPMPDKFDPRLKKLTAVLRKNFRVRWG